MAMTALSTLNASGQILKYVPGQPAGEMTQLLPQAAREFCRETWAWAEELSGVALVAGQTLYSITVPDTHLAEVLAVQTLERVSAAGVTQRTFLKSEYEVKPDNKVEFFAAPLQAGQSTTDTLTLGLIWLPKESAVNLPDWFLNRWGEAIRARVLADLLALHGTTRAHALLAERREAQYRRLVGEAKGEALTRRQAGPAALQIPEFY